jgi:hypothetical protein
MVEINLNVKNVEVLVYVSITDKKELVKNVVVVLFVSIIGRKAVV